MFIIIAGRRSCPYCVQAVQMAEQYAPLSYLFIDLAIPAKKADFERRFRPFVPQSHTTIPIVFINGQFIGGYDTLSQLLAANNEDLPSPLFV
jgi:glutaredoxin 1